MKYGVIGLGNLGGKIAANLLAAGFDLQVHDLSREAAAQLEADGARWCGSPAEAADGADGLLTYGIDCPDGPVDLASLPNHDERNTKGIPNHDERNTVGIQPKRSN